MRAIPAIRLRTAKCMFSIEYSHVSEKAFVVSSRTLFTLFSLKQVALQLQRGRAMLCVRQ